MQQKINWLVFDLGKVLIRHETEWIYRKLSQLTGISYDELKPWIAKDEKELFSRLTIEDLSDSQVHQMFGNRYGKELTEMQVVELLNSNLGSTIQETEDLLVSLSARYNTACLSNTCSHHWRWMEANCKFLTLFKVKFASQLMGLKKPDAAIYIAAQKELHAEPAEILFFDDKIENIEGARAVGWNAEQYIDHQKLLSDLKRYQIEV